MVPGSASIMSLELPRDSAFDKTTGGGDGDDADDDDDDDDILYTRSVILDKHQPSVCNSQKFTLWLHSGFL